MIKFTLRCAEGHEFDGWFADSDTFEKQQTAGLLDCAICGSADVDKALMAPSVRGTKKNDKVEVAAHHELTKEALDIARKLKKHVTENADYVGDKFADEARKIHYEEVERRGIYGEATGEEVSGLVEEGIEFHPLPTLPEEKN